LGTILIFEYFGLDLNIHYQKEPMEELFQYLGGDPDSDQCILFIHGNSLDHQLFDPFFNSEFLNLYKLVAPDLPGHGKSATPASDRVYSLTGLTGVLERLITGITSPNMIIIGHSLGGHIGIHLADRIKSRMKKLILIGTPPLGSLEDMQRGFHPHELMGLVYKQEINPDEAGQLAEAYGLTNSDFLSKKILATDSQFRASFLNDLLNSPFENEIEKLKKLDLPVLMIHGAEDPFINVSYIEEIGLNLSGKRVHYIENAGHCGFYDDPVPYLKLIEAYLTD
jgi:pimeloyl-ACP methyl ester carboxylesterase